MTDYSIVNEKLSIKIGNNFDVCDICKRKILFEKKISKDDFARECKKLEGNLTDKPVLKFNNKDITVCMDCIKEISNLYGNDQNQVVDNNIEEDDIEIEDDENQEDDAIVKDDATDDKKDIKKDKKKKNKNDHLKKPESEEL